MDTYLPRLDDSLVAMHEKVTEGTVGHRRRGAYGVVGMPDSWWLFAVEPSSIKCHSYEVASE